VNLKESLRDLARGTEYKKYCKFGGIYMGLDDETKELLSSALKGSASTMAITRALNADGIDVRREHIGEKRACFTGENPNCCLNKCDTQDNNGTITISEDK
jgi:hypothetical protein